MPAPVPPAAVPVAAAPVATSGAPAAFKTAVGECPRDGTPKLPTGGAQDALHVPEAALHQYSDADMDDKGYIPLEYPALAKGGTYCTKGDTKTVTMGGTLLFNTGGGCVAPPTKADGTSCCQMKTWQPDAGGFYLDNCSMACATHLLGSSVRLRSYTKVREMV